MALKVVGAGLGRTGTHSLKVALEPLLGAPCYHMVEVFSHPGHSEAWEAAARGESIDWNWLLGSYKAAVDWPAAYFWRELSAMHPDARIILTERDAEAWYRSFSSTILEFMQRGDEGISEPILLAQRKMGRFLLAQSLFGSRFDKDHVIDVYRKSNEAVRREVPKGRLLVFDAPDGWGPLCEFLGVPVPETPYPLTNTAEEFRARAASRASNRH